MSYVLQLNKINKKFTDQILKSYNKEDGGKVNDTLLSLFQLMNHSKNEHQVLIKVAALNSIYSTGILYIKPVAMKIVNEINMNIDEFGELEFINLVDKISMVSWKNESTKKNHERNNLSFASKYIHFLSGCRTPIYDSYIWLTMIGYLNQFGDNSYSYNKPNNYVYFHEKFTEFKTLFNLNSLSIHRAG